MSHSRAHLVASARANYLRALGRVVEALERLTNPSTDPTVRDFAKDYVQFCRDHARLAYEDYIRLLASDKDNA